MAGEKAHTQYAHPSMVQAEILKLSKDSFMPPYAHRPVFYEATDDGESGTFIDAKREMHDEAEYLGVPVTERDIYLTAMHRAGLKREVAHQLLRSMEIVNPEAESVAA